MSRIIKYVTDETKISGEIDIEKVTYDLALMYAQMKMQKNYEDNTFSSEETASLYSLQEDFFRAFYFFSELDDICYKK